MADTRNSIKLQVSIWCCLFIDFGKFSQLFNTGSMVGGVAYGNVFEGSSDDLTDIFFGGLFRGPEQNTGTLSSVIAF